MNVVTATPIWKLWADALDRSLQGVAFITDAGNQCAPTAGAGLTVNIASGTVVVNTGSTTTAISAGSVTPTSPTNNPRRDIVFISSLGALTLTQGTEAPAPLPPSLPTGACLIAVLFIPQSATDYSAGFPTSGIEDLRVIRQVDAAVGIGSLRTLGTGATQAATGTHTTPVFVASGASHAAGHVPDPGASAGTTKFLREDATFATPPSATATVAGYVPTPPNNTTTFLRGDATFAAPPSATVTTATNTAGFSTSSATFVDVTSLSISVTVSNANNKVKYEWDGAWSSGGTGTVQILNSTDSAALVDTVTTTSATTSGYCFAVVTQAASAKTVKVQGKTSAGSLSILQVGLGPSTLSSTEYK